MQQRLPLDRLSCHRFVANAFRLVLAAFAYGLLRTHRQVLAGTELENASVQTTRSRLIKIGARVVRTVRRVWVHLCSAFPLREVLVRAWRAIRSLPAAAT